MVEAVDYCSSLLHIHIVYIKSVWAYSYAVDMQMSAFLHCYTITLLVKLTQIWVIWGSLGMVWWNNDMLTWLRQYNSLLHIHKICIKSDWAHSYAVDRHIGVPLHCYTSGHIVLGYGNLGMVGLNNDLLTWLLLYNTVHFFSTSIVNIYKVLEHIHILWIGIWVHPCTFILPANKLTQIWVIWGWSDEIVMYLHGCCCTTPLTSSPHPYCIYRKRLSTFICCGHAYVCTKTMLHCWPSWPRFG
jgi:hypothetical protein